MNKFGLFTLPQTIRKGKAVSLDTSITHVHPLLLLWNLQYKYMYIPFEECLSCEK